MDGLDDPDDIDDLAAALAGADTAAAFTGAGVSTASGVPSFRGEDGIWETEFDPADFHVSRLDRDPAGFWRDRVALHDRMFGGSIEPNAAHDALARLERADYLEGTITQNTDGLHAAAGSDRVLELHGNARRVVCRDCGRRTDAGPVRERAADGELPPTCEGCGGVLKPDVVLFGERLPRSTLTAARTLAAQSDVFLAVGSSLQVEPAASLPRNAARDGVLAIVNLESTPLDDDAALVLRRDVTAVLPALADRLDA